MSFAAWALSNASTCCLPILLGTCAPLRHPGPAVRPSPLLHECWGPSPSAHLLVHPLLASQPSPCSAYPPALHPPLLCTGDPQVYVRGSPLYPPRLHSCAVIRYLSPGCLYSSRPPFFSSVTSVARERQGHLGIYRMRVAPGGGGEGQGGTPRSCRDWPFLLGLSSQAPAAPPLAPHTDLVVLPCRWEIPSPP